ncbi:MAG: oxidoreductase [Fulvivirga sp.]|nr:oxidoreductase [Fulvivirga sp.]
MKKQVVLVTGASSGIGKATARQLLQDGYTVYVAARRVDKMEDLKKEGALPLQMDITSEDDVKNVVTAIAARDGGVDILINNAGYAIYGSVEETSLKDARRQFEVNIFGLAYLTQLVIPYMREQRAGKIINMSSMGGKMYTPLGAWYHGTKHALEGWSDSLRLELKPFGIDVVIIEPGVIMTEFGDVMMKPMLERSGDGPYAHIAKPLAKATEESYNQGQGSRPELIARVIAKAVKAKRPKTRYVRGKFARPMMFIRKWLGDRIFDKVVMSQVN